MDVARWGGRAGGKWSIFQEGNTESKGLGSWARHDVSVTQENVWID